MVPDKFNMVDMGGIDLIMMQGAEVPGLYNKLVESITQCQYQCLYNWLFDGILIPPTYVKMEVNEDDEVAINEGVTVDSDDVVHIHSLEPTIVMVPLLAEENGTYLPPEGVDGFSQVVVDVQPPVPNAILRPLNAYYVLTNWIFNNSDDFDWIYKNITAPNVSTNWPVYLSSQASPGGAAGDSLLVQGNFYSGRRVMNVSYAGQWSGDGTWSYDSPYDYDNFYKLTKRGNNFTLYKGSSLDNITTVAFQGSFANSNNNDTNQMKLFWSNNSFSVYFIQLIGYDSQGNIIHNYVPDYDGKVKDLVDEELFSPTGSAISVTI